MSTRNCDKSIVNKDAEEVDYLLWLWLSLVALYG